MHLKGRSEPELDFLLFGFHFCRRPSKLRSKVLELLLLNIDRD